METPILNRNLTDDEENKAIGRRIQRLSLHLTPVPRPLGDLQLRTLACAARAKLNVDVKSLSVFMRGKHRDIQEKIFDFFNARSELQTPVEISKDNHRELCMRQLLALVREAGVRPFSYVADEPTKYFAILEAVGSVDMSLGIKMGVQYR